MIRKIIKQEVPNDDANNGHPPAPDVPAIERVGDPDEQDDDDYSTDGSTTSSQYRDAHSESSYVGMGDHIPDAPWGYTKAGCPKKKPGRKRKN